MLKKKRIKKIYKKKKKRKVCRMFKLKKTYDVTYNRCTFRLSINL